MERLDTRKAAQCEIRYYRNDARELIISVTEDGSAVNLTGKSLKMQIKRRKNDPDSKVLYELTTSSGIAISGTEGNIITISLEFNLEEDDYYYDLENTTDKTTLIYGKFIVTGDVTR